MSEADDALLHVHLDHVQPKSWLEDYNFQVSHLVTKFKMCENLS